MALNIRNYDTVDHRFANLMSTYNLVTYIEAEHFGAITEKLHEALITDPKPYRRDVKNMLSNLLKMIERLGMEEVVIDRPNHSQRVRLLTGNLVD